MIMIIIIRILEYNSEINVMRAVEGKTSHWLSVMPIAKQHFDLSAVEFWRCHVLTIL